QRELFLDEVAADLPPPLRAPAPDLIEPLAAFVGARVPLHALIELIGDVPLASIAECAHEVDAGAFDRLLAAFAEAAGHVGEGDAKAERVLVFAEEDRGVAGGGKAAESRADARVIEHLRPRAVERDALLLHVLIEPIEDRAHAVAVGDDRVAATCTKE